MLLVIDNGSIVASTIAKLSEFFSAINYTGYDPYDGLNSPILRFFSFGIPQLRLYAQQLIKKSSINLRWLLGIKKDINPKGMGLIAMGYLNLYENTKENRYAEKAKTVLNWLKENPSKGYSGYCWGYNFDWQSRAFFLPAGTPTVVNTSFISRAFVKAYEIFKDKDYLDIARSSCDFILKDLNRLDNGDLLCFSYSPLDHYFVHNATGLGSSLLAMVYDKTQETTLLENARKSLRYVAKHQQNDGAWYYGEDETARKTGIDNFHTGFVLESFKIYASATKDHSFDENIKKGLEFYQKNFFLSDGAPKYFYNKIYPLDIHSACQAIITLIQLKEYGSDMELCKRIYEWMIKNMWDEKRGYFYYQKHKFFTNKIPYIRWSQAWAFYTLSSYYNNFR